MEWPNGLQRCAAANIAIGLSPQQCLWTHDLQVLDQKGLAATLTDMQSAGVTPEVNLMIIWVRKHKKDPQNVTGSPKQEYQWPHKKDLCPPKIEKHLQAKVLSPIFIYRKMQYILGRKKDLNSTLL